MLSFMKVHYHRRINVCPNVALMTYFATPDQAMTSVHQVFITTSSSNDQAFVERTLLDQTIGWHSSSTSSLADCTTNGGDQTLTNVGSSYELIRVFPVLDKAMNQWWPFSHHHQILWRLDNETHYLRRFWTAGDNHGYHHRYFTSYGIKSAMMRVPTWQW